jgi:hypothetical protein
MEEKLHLLRFSLVIALVTIPSAVLANCVAPITPSCVNHQSMFLDRQEFEQCREQVEGFRGQTRDYLLCLKGEVGEGLNRFNRAVDLFNLRAHLTDEGSGIKPAAKEAIY